MVVTHKPRPKQYPEKIGDREYLLEEKRLHIFDDVALWHENPRLQQYVTGEVVNSDEELEAFLQQTRGYDTLKTSISTVGQLEPIYVWKRESMDKYLVLEGATRVAILRELARAKKGQPDEDKYKYVIAKELPEDFSIQDRIILLARIHVRGTGVRQWGRYIEARFVYESVTPTNGQAPVMSVAELARHMGKSQSWVSRLKDAYEFGMTYVHHFDDADAMREAIQEFSTLEEISKSTGFGPKVRQYGTPESDALRTEVFDMVRAGVFQEYRDARFMKSFYDDPEKWARLKTHEKSIAHQLANEIKAGSTNLHAKISNLRSQIDRALGQDPDSLGDDDLRQLEDSARYLEARLTNVPPFRRRVRGMIDDIFNASLEDLKHVTTEDLDELTAGIDDLRHRMERLTKRAVAS